MEHRQIDFNKDGAFYAKHPDIKGVVNKYTRTDINGNILEVWERDETGTLVDVTERVRLEREVQEAKKALEDITND